MHLSRRAAIGLIAATLVIASTAYTWTCYRDRTMSHQLFSSPMHTLCVGRYLIDVPAQYELEGYDFRIDSVDIIWQYSIRNEEEFRKQLSAREAELKAAKNEYGKQSLESAEDFNSPAYTGRLLKFARTPPLTWTELGKEVSGKEGLSVEAWLWMDGHAVKLSGKDLQIDYVDTVAFLAKPLRALAIDEIPAEPGFCMEMLEARAMIVGLPGHDQTEKSEVQFGLKDHPDVKFDFTMYTNGDKLREPLHVRSARADSEMANLMPLFSKLRNGSRTVHGIEGDEEAEAVRELNGTRGLNFGWEPLGRPNDPFSPYIVFDMKTGYSHDGPVQSSLSDDVALQLWDAVVGSIRLRPTGPAKASSGEGSAAPKPKTPVGTNVHTGSVCPESGWWWGPDTDEGVDPRHFFRAGEVMPRANIEAPLSALDKLLGRRPRIDVSTVWKLVAYATDSELRQKPIRPADPV